MATKHERIIQYIENLPVGEKISVRQIAKELGVSEGTAYRAIKDAELKGLVTTIERVGTIRIEKKRKENIERLTYAEVVNIVDGQTLGGKAGLHKTLKKFVIGAMELEAMKRYIEAGNLLIVGNRINAQIHALKSGAAVLITGGFDTTDEVKKIANELELPIISTSYDTFTVATLINRAIFDRLIKKEILLVGDIYIPREKTYFLFRDDTVERWFELNRKSNHTRFPVIDRNGKLEGIVTAKDVLGQDRAKPIEKIMTKNPIVTTPQMSVAYASHMMIWEGIELLPVVDDSDQLLGILSRQDVLKALQTHQRQPHVGETIDNLISRYLNDTDLEAQGNGDVYTFEVTPQMTTPHGTISYGVITTLITEAVQRSFRRLKKGELVVETLTFYFLRPVQMESIIEIRPNILETGRKFGKAEIGIHCEGKVVCKAMIMVQFIDR